MLLQLTVCIFFTAFTRVGTHSCITRIWCTPLHHNKGRAFSFTVQLRQLRVRMPCGGCTQRSLGVLNICPHFRKLGLQPNTSFKKALGDVSASNLGKNTGNPERDFPQILDANTGQHQTTSYPLRQKKSKIVSVHVMKHMGKLRYSSTHHKLSTRWR